jgi:hypothetical protein
VSSLQTEEESASEILKKSAAASASQTAFASELGGIDGDTAAGGLSEFAAGSKAIARGESTFVASEKNSLLETSESIKELEFATTQSCQSIKCTFEDGKYTHHGTYACH